jgi:hypothetical protein
MFFERIVAHPDALVFWGTTGLAACYILASWLT